VVNRNDQAPLQRLVEDASDQRNIDSLVLPEGMAPSDDPLPSALSAVPWRFVRTSDLNPTFQNR
jgi:hypothetical protein